MKREEKGAIVIVMPGEVMFWLIRQGYAYDGETVKTIEFNCDNNIEITLERER